MKAIWYLIGIAVLVVAGFFLFSGSNRVTGSVVSSTGEVQELTLGMQDLNYYPNTLTVESGRPVRITLDETVKGCLRSFTIPSFGISKYAKTPSDFIEFTPTNKGTFAFTCSMGMGTGKLIVK